MTCRFQKVPVVFNKSLVDLKNGTSFVKSTCDLLNSTCAIDLLKLLARRTQNSQIILVHYAISIKIVSYCIAQRRCPLTRRSELARALIANI